MLRSLRPLLPLLALASCALFELAAIDKAYPDHAGTLALPGLSAPVTVHRDGLGVPHIRAETEHDAAAALGFVHAQDRLFQADLRRKLAWGEISTWLGEDAAELDLFVQAMDLRAAARRSYAALSPEARAGVEAYTRGFNAGAASLPALPIEYRLLGAEFSPWQPEDMYATVYLQSWGLAENAPYEAFALLFAEKLSAADADRLFRLSGEGSPTEPSWDRLRMADIAPFDPGYVAWAEAMGGIPDTSSASNNWVVGPSRSASGAPIVANDPHLGQSVPSLWYAADVQGGDLHVAGVTLAGVPGVVIGHNERVAWGLTNVMTDSVDFAVLRRDGEAGVVVDGQTETLERVTVSAAGRERVVYKSSLGPLVTELSGTHVVALRWHALSIEDTAIDAFLALSHAESVEQGLAAFAGAEMSIAQNLVLADVDGDFAWQQVGSVLAREGYSGRVPYDASSPDTRWIGPIADLPGERAPERGYVHTANSMPEDPRADFGAFYVPPWRHGRIDALLAGEELLDVDDMARVQADLVETAARALLPELLAGVQPSTHEAATCHAELAAWDHVVAVDSSGAAVWAFFQRELLREVLRDDLGEEGAAAYLSIASSGRNALMGELSAIVDDRSAAVDTALHAACTALFAAYGEDPAERTWGEVHPLALTHPFAGSRKLLSKWNMEPVPWPGNGSTVAAAGHGWTGERMPVGGMVSMRIVMPLADLGASTLVHPGGQVGHPRHPLYASHYASFVAGETEPLWFDDEDVLREAEGTLLLMP